MILWFVLVAVILNIIVLDPRFVEGLFRHGKQAVGH